ncbi:hypothetical protein ACFY7C_19490 [Streptomyces sp. NPDC012769]|uniref:hypothetical protein n=1 Tax=Streptomyces sp. NPDC012769 TaxID=3364848 RepID=UPI0036C9C10F
MNIIARGESGVMLPAEAQMLRDAVELLDELGMLHDAVTSKGDCRTNFDFEPSTTQSFRVHLGCEIPESRCKDCE